MMIDAESLAAQLRESRVPEHMHEGIVLWLTEGIEPGSFMMAVLCNDLRDACMRADGKNRYRLFDFVDFLYNYAPAIAWGSVDNVERWAMQHQARRDAAMESK